jgi:AcrR family transcriptional regulator
VVRGVPDDEHHDGPEDDDGRHHDRGPPFAPLEGAPRSGFGCGREVFKIRLVYSRPRGDDASKYLHGMKTPPQVSRRRPPARQLLLSAAARVFARDGLDGATTRAISREAGVNEVTLFRQFGTKEHLIEVVVGSAFGRGGSAPGAPAGTARGLREDLESFAGDYEALLVANLPLIRTMIGEIHRHAVCQHQALRGIFWPMRAALVRRLGLACRRGEARAGMDPALAADILAGSIFCSVLRRSTATRRGEYSPAAYRKACVSIFLGGIAA